MRRILLTSWLFLTFSLSAQVIPSARRTDWTSPGYQGTLPTPVLWKDIMTFGGNKTGSADNTAAISSAIASLSGAAGVVYFPAGTYLFNSSISIPANVIIKGASSDSTTFNFSLSGATINCINVVGMASAAPITVTAGGTLGSKSITLSATTGISVGSYIEFRVDGTGFMTSSWAMDDLAQICKVTAIAGNTITIAKPLRWRFNLSTNPRVYLLSPLQNVGFECFKITRLDTSANQSTMINFQYAANCWVKGVESFKTTFAHVAFSKSIHCEATESYFHRAWSYGGGGRAYGVCVQASSSECLVQNCIFEHLRHGVLLQSGANGTVVGYNSFSTPFWNEGFFPTNSAGELVLHGNFPFMNLFEGNLANNIVIDNSHGINGPFNTVFRNRASIWGIFMNSGAGDSTNIVNNEIVANSPTIIPSSYTLTGIGNFTYGNNRAGTPIPAGTASPPDWTSYYLAFTPTWFASGSLPTVGYANTFNSGTVPARTRFTAGVLNRCGCPARSACSFTVIYTLDTMATCCGGSFYQIRLTPTSGSPSYSFFSDGVTYLTSVSAPVRLTYLPPFNRTVTIAGTDRHGCIYTSTIVLP